MRGKGFASAWLYGPVKPVRIPSWLEAEVKAYCHRREVERFRGEVRSLKGALAMAAAPALPEAPPSKSQQKKLVQAQARAAKKKQR